MPAIPTSFGDFTFPTRGAAEAFVRSNIVAANVGVTRVPVGRIHDALLDLIQQHPQAAAKIGSGVDHFRVDPASEWNPAVPVKSTNYTLVVKRVDGTEEDWSWVAAVRQPSAIAQKRSAMRNALYARIQATKRSALAGGPAVCPRTGVIISTVDEARVAHRSPSWARLTDDFAATIGGWGSLTTVSTGAGAEISDPVVQAAWETDYDANARPSIESKP